MANPTLNNPLNDAARLGERIKQARSKQEMTQSGLAVKADLSRSALVHYEQGHALPGGAELVKLAIALKVSPNFLLSGSDEFFASESPNHLFAIGSQAQMITRIAMCLMVLDRETKESVSSLLMSMVKAKMNKREFQGFMQAMEQVGEVLPEMGGGLEKMADKAYARIAAQKPAAKKKAK